MANFQRLPNFFIIGAAKSGTTTLHDLLRQHQEVYVPGIKEPMFFNREEHFGKGLGWYEKTFFHGAERRPARGEATPHYLYWSGKVAPRLKALYGDGDVRFVACFRDPVKRAYSHYWNMVREGKEDLSFAEAVAAEDERLEKNGRFLDEQGSMLYGYVEGGRYTKLLRPFLELFPRERFLFLLQEDLRDDLDGVMAKLFGFLGIDDSVKVEGVSSNPATMPRSKALHGLLRGRSALKEAVKPFLPYSVRGRIMSRMTRFNLKKTEYPPMNARLESALRRGYRDEMDSLQGIIGRDLSRWMPGG